MPVYIHGGPFNWLAFESLLDCLILDNGDCLQYKYTKRYDTIYILLLLFVLEKHVYCLGNMGGTDGTTCKNSEGKGIREEFKIL